MSDMNEEQRAAIAHVLGPLLIAAVAGCGKTTAIVERIKYLIDTGVDPADILAVTFSTKAAREMTMRLARTGYTGARVGTFHSLALQILREELPHFTNWKIDDSDRYRLCIKDAVSFREMDWKAADVTYLAKFITLCKAQGGFPTESDERTLAVATALHKHKRGLSTDPTLSITAYEVAERIRKERRLLTFDDMIFECWDLLRTEEQARRRWAGRWLYVLQDECQDENLVQRELAEMLARDHRNYCIVGDPAQSIYAFRGANPDGMLAFEKKWNARVIRMGRNYRCATTIVQAANNLLKAMPAHTHLGVEMLAQREIEGEIAVRLYPNFDDEGAGVTEQILESHEDGVAWSKHVVLYRTNAQSRGVEEQLLSARVPYVVLGGTNFYDRREVKDLLAYLRVAACVGTFDDVRRSINTPFRYLGKVFLDGLEEALDGIEGPFLLEGLKQYATSDTAHLQKRQRTSALEYCSIVHECMRAIQDGEAHPTQERTTPLELAARPSRLLDQLVRRLGYTEWLTRDEGSESPENNRVANVRELVRAADRFPTTAELLAYVDDTLERAAKAKKEVRESDVVTLCSIHRAKGLEWPIVFVIGANEKIIPHGHCDDINEERRLFYVAMTRAADRLEISYVEEAAVSNKVMNLEPSRFIAESGLVVKQSSTSQEAS